MIFLISHMTITIVMKITLSYVAILVGHKNVPNFFRKRKKLTQQDSYDIISDVTD